MVRVPSGVGILWYTSSVLPTFGRFTENGLVASEQIGELTFLFPHYAPFAGLLKHSFQVLENLPGLSGGSYSPYLLALSFRSRQSGQYW